MNSINLTPRDLSSDFPPPKITKLVGYGLIAVPVYAAITYIQSFTDSYPASFTFLAALSSTAGVVVMNEKEAIKENRKKIIDLSKNIENLTRENQIALVKFLEIQMSHDTKDLELYLNNQFTLAIAYKYGLGTEMDKARAFNYFLNIAQQRIIGNKLVCQAIVQVAQMYYTGDGAPQSDVNGMHWEKKAAENGDKPSMYNLAMAYFQGDLVPQNLKRAFLWFRKIEDEYDVNRADGITEGMIYQTRKILSEMYETGSGGIVDLSKSKQLIIDLMEIHGNVGPCNSYLNRIRSS